MNTEHAATHAWVAARTGMSVAGVSLLRSGNRLPSMFTMETIEKAFDWPLCDQTEARRGDGSAYAQQFNEAIEKAYQKEISV